MINDGTDSDSDPPRNDTDGGDGIPSEDDEVLVFTYEPARLF
jgi:hypothetical protein